MLASFVLSTAMLGSFPLGPPPPADDAPLRDWFGFSSLEVLPVGDDPGPMCVDDVDGDGLTDIVVANNRRSRIEILRQRPADERLDAPEPAQSVNEFPEHTHWERQLVPVADQVKALLVHDVNGDGRNDFIAAGSPGRITMLLQQDDGTFDAQRRKDIRSLAASTNAFTLVDIVGDAAPELISIVDGDLAWWPLEDGRLGAMERRPAGVKLVGVIPADYDGDGLIDIAGIAPDDAAPVRLWFARQDGNDRSIGGQTPFEMSPIAEFEAITLPGQQAARIAVIERPARRLVLHEVQRVPADDDPDITLMGFADSGNRNRPVVLADVNADGLQDVITADAKGNAIAVFRQQAGTGLLPAESSPTVAEVDGLAVLPEVDGAPARLVVLSTKEGFVGTSDLVDSGTIAFPSAIQGAKGWEPKAIAATSNAIAIVRNSGRKYKMDLVHADGSEGRGVDLGSLSRAPTSIVVADVDQDGLEDMLLITNDRPLMLLLGEADGAWTVLEKDDMGQYGLIGDGDAAAMVSRDIDGDGQSELLSADRNYVRALRYDRDGDAPGWQVVSQMNANDSDADLMALVVTEDGLIAADREANELVLFADEGDGMSQSETIALPGIEPRRLAVGALTGDANETVLVLGDDAMATVTRAGDKVALREAGTWRSSLENHAPHEFAVGDVNGDGRVDLLLLDAGEQMLEILTFNDSGSMEHAMGFPVFESRIFSGGQGREYQPRQAWVADMNGDGRDDVILLVHDRILVYPQ